MVFPAVPSQLLRTIRALRAILCYLCSGGRIKSVTIVNDDRMNITNSSIFRALVKHKMPFVVIIALDCLACLAGMLGLLWATRSGATLLRDIVPISHTLLLFLVCNLVGFRMFRTYAGILRYSTIADIKKVVGSTAVAYLLAVAIEYVLRTAGTHRFFYLFTPSAALALFAAGMLLMILMRVVINLMYDSAFVARNAQNVLVYGVSDGAAISALIHSEKPVRFLLKGFVSDNDKEHNSFCAGKRIYSIQKDLPMIIERLRIQAFIVSPSMQRAFSHNQRLQDKLLDGGIAVYVCRSIRSEEGSSLGGRIDKIAMEDLLSRDEIEIDIESIASALKGQRILVSGSGGSIGGELVRLVATFKPAEMILIDSAETPQHDMRLMMRDRYPEVKTWTIVTSMCRKERMRKIFEEHRPDYVFHAAAYKHVPMMEDNPSEAVLNNVVGTRVLSDLSVEFGVKKFVMISTDKAVNPSSVMGCSKRICEIYAQSLDEAEKNGTVEGKTQFITTRFGNVLGSNGSVIHLFRKQLQEGGPLTVTHPDIIRYFMLIPEACKLVLEAGVKGKGGEIFVFDMGAPIRIVDLAKRMIELSGQKNIKIMYTGLRNGEKLYEEVLDDKETTLPSFHKKIRIAQVREEEYTDVCRKIDALVEAARTLSDQEIVEQMKAMVPEYKPLNTVY